MKLHLPTSGFNLLVSLHRRKRRRDRVLHPRDAGGSVGQGGVDGAAARGRRSRRRGARRSRRRDGSRQACEAAARVKLTIGTSTTVRQDDDNDELLRHHLTGMENVMSSFILHRFCNLVADGVKTDKGFKEVHLNSVARDLKDFTRQDVTGTQVYNHLCKWRARLVKICSLKNLSGAGWDEDNFMITLSPDHYNGHTLHHSKDAKFLNQPLWNYIQMQTIFASGADDTTHEG